jgi:hypothetical protein
MDLVDVEVAEENEMSQESKRVEPQPSSFMEMEIKGTVALDGDTRRCCNNPDCSNDYPCPTHPESKRASTLEKENEC